MYQGKFDWSAVLQQPTDVRGYVKEVIMNCIGVHAEVGDATGGCGAPDARARPVTGSLLTIRRCGRQDGELGVLFLVVFSRLHNCVFPCTLSEFVRQCLVG